MRLRDIWAPDDPALVLFVFFAAALIEAGKAHAIILLVSAFPNLRHLRALFVSGTTQTFGVRLEIARPVGTGDIAILGTAVQRLAAFGIVTKASCV